ncbi:MAG: glycine oxidase ThiO [Cyanobacteria bacterium J06626_14]
MSDGCDILIGGGGIVGLAIALELRLRGSTVMVLTRDRQQAATRAAAGMLAPHAERLPDGPLRDFGLKSLHLYPEWIANIEHLSNLKTGYWPSGILAPVLAPVLNTEPNTQGQNGHQDPSTTDSTTSSATAQWLDETVIHHVHPGLSRDVVGGWWYPDDGQVDNRALFQALWHAAEQAGVTIKEAIAVESFQSEQGRVTGVRTSEGCYQAEHYILATGAWSTDLLPVPVRPMKGQMLAVQVPSLDNSSSKAELPLKRILFGDGCYIVPRLDGRILIGATMESVGFQAHNTVDGIQSLVNSALQLYPQLKDYPIVEQWWGYRPTTPDEAPLLGPTYYANLTIATGHHRNGILFAPATAQLIADWVLNHASNRFLDAFSIHRFSGLPTQSSLSSNSQRLTPTNGKAIESVDRVSSNYHSRSTHHASTHDSSGHSVTHRPSSSSKPMPTLYSSSHASPSPAHPSSASLSLSSESIEPDDASLVIAGRAFRSRLMTGTGKYQNFDHMHGAIAASGCQIVTVAVRRVQTQAPGHEGLAEALDWTQLWMLPNTAGCKTADEAIRVARLGREMAKLLGQEDNNFVKLEVIPDATYLLPDPIGTLEAAEQLVKEGFAVLPYINADPLLAKRLEEAGCATVMPLGSPIGSGQGIRNAANIQIIIENATVPVVVDAGIGTPSEAAQAMEMGADALLINTAIAKAQNPVAMGRAMGLAAVAGRLAYHAGRIPIQSDASASSPLTGKITE